MSLLFWIVGASLLGSLISFVGLTFVFFGAESIKKYMYYFISFAVGTLLGVVFLDLLPEAIELAENSDAIFLYVLAGFIVFFVLEKILFWHHCHDGECSVHASGYLILWGDAIHNFIDGVIIALAFMGSIPLGIVTAFAVILHEVPQEISDFLILISSGFTKGKALFYNFLVALMSVLGAVITFIFASGVEGLIAPALGIVAGHFLYVSASDLVPELHLRQPTKSKIFWQTTLIILGVLVIWASQSFLPF